MRCFDETAHENDENFAAAVNDWLAPSRFAILLVGVYTASLERVSRFLNLFDPARVCRVVGGPHITVAPQTVAAHFAVRGEGGAAVRHIVNTLFTPWFGQGEDAVGMCFIDRGKQIATKVAFDRSIAEVPSPAYDYSHCAPPPRAHWARTVGRAQQISPVRRAALHVLFHLLDPRPFARARPRWSRRLANNARALWLRRTTSRR